MSWKTLTISFWTHANYGVEGREACVLIANQAAHHIAAYGGVRWKELLRETFALSGVKLSWLDNLAFIYKLQNGFQK